MTYPLISPARRLEMLEWPAKPVRMVLDTDTFNEVDDQFALAYTLLSPDRLHCEAIYAAPFFNDRSTGPEDGMLKSYDEILRILARMDRPAEGFVHHGSRRWLTGGDGPTLSPAADDLVRRALMPADGPLYVVAIGAITNVASAILAAPEIIERIVVVWLGGNPYYWYRATEFNMYQDMAASRLILDCGVPLVQIPCINVTEHLKTTQAELARYVKGSGALGEYLYETFSAYHDDHYAWSKEIWDVGAIAWLVNQEWVESAVIHSPILTDDQTWSHDPRRHMIREATRLRRDKIFADLFRKLEAHAR